jgi:hypothetical protein
MRIREKRETESLGKRKRTMDEDTKPRDVQRRLRGKQKKPVPLETTGSRKRKLEDDQAIESETEQKRTKRGDEINNGATSSRSWSHSRVVQTNDRRLSTESCGKSSNIKDNDGKRKASDIEGGRSKAKEEGAVRRILSTCKAKVPDAAEGGGAAAVDETDNELIEQCWQDLLTDGARQDEQEVKEGKAEDADAKRYKYQEPAYDIDPKLPGDNSITGAIKARLWSENRGPKRITIDEHTRIQEGNRSKDFVMRTRGASSERECKVLKRTDSRMMQDDKHAIQRLILQGATTACSGPSRKCATGSCSSDAGPGSFLKKPP